MFTFVFRDKDFHQYVLSSASGEMFTWPTYTQAFNEMLECSYFFVCLNGSPLYSRILEVNEEIAHAKVTAKLFKFILRRKQFYGLMVNGLLG